MTPTYKIDFRKNKFVLKQENVIYTLIELTPLQAAQMVDDGANVTQRACDELNRLVKPPLEIVGFDLTNATGGDAFTVANA